MAVSVLKRPKGYINSSTQKTITSVLNGSGSALFICSVHGFSEGDVIYIKTNVQNYNGYFTVTLSGVGDPGDSFYILPLEAGSVVPVPYINNATGAAKSTEDVYWNCVHLPIVYELTNTLWPTNSNTSVDPIVTINSVTNSSGYCALSLSGDIKAGIIASEVLEYVQVTGTTDYNGVYQIIARTNDTAFSIDLPYSSDADSQLTNASIQFYYNNYSINVQVWGGLDNEHTYYSEKPYELLATLKLIPDENNKVKFSINEILKKHIEISNNLLLGTLPNNLNAFTKFFIKYAESYDEPDGDVLETFTTSYTSDLANFEGFAVNSKLPFKNVYSGALSEYASQDENQKFLTVFDRPVLFNCPEAYSECYQDISVILEMVPTLETSFIVRSEYFLNSVQQSVVEEIVDGVSDGVYRLPLTPNCTYDRMDLLIQRRIVATSPDSFENVAGAGENWFLEDDLPNVILDSEEESDYVRFPVDLPPYAYEINFTISNSNAGTGDSLASVFLADISGNAISQTETFPVNEAFANVDITLDASDSDERVRYIYLKVERSAGTGSYEFESEFPDITESEQTVSETITFYIECACGDDFLFISWLNNLGGFDYWNFTAYKDHQLDIRDSGETETNVFNEWPNSYGEFADTIRKQTYRISGEQKVVRSQNLTLDQVNALKTIKTSPLVQIVNSIYDRRTVIVDTESFVVYKEGQKEQYTISFTITYTDDVPSQRI